MLYATHTLPLREWQWHKSQDLNSIRHKIVQIVLQFCRKRVCLKSVKSFLTFVCDPRNCLWSLVSFDSELPETRTIIRPFFYVTKVLFMWKFVLHGLQHGVYVGRWLRVYVLYSLEWRRRCQLMRECMPPGGRNKVLHFIDHLKSPSQSGSHNKAPTGGSWLNSSIDVIQYTIW